MSVDIERSCRPEIIRAFHGVSATGSWFLLADLAPKQHDSDIPCVADHRAFDSNWLVVLGRSDRDIITLQGADS